MDPRFIRGGSKVGAAAQIEGTSVVGGIPPTPGSAGGTASIMNIAPPAVSRTLIFWGVAVGVLVLFHVGGSRLG